MYFWWFSKRFLLSILIIAFLNVFFRIWFSPCLKMHIQRVPLSVRWVHFLSFILMQTLLIWLSFFCLKAFFIWLCSWFHENSYWIQGQDVYKSAQVRDKQIYRILGQVLLCLLIWCPHKCIYNIMYFIYRHLQLQQLLFWGQQGSLMFFLWATFLIQRTYSICWTQCKPLSISPSLIGYKRLYLKEVNLLLQSVLIFFLLQTCP